MPGGVATVRVVLAGTWREVARRARGYVAIVTATDVTRILERLSVIEAKMDAGKDMSARLRRTELAIVAIIAYVVKDAARAAGIL